MIKINEDNVVIDHKDLGVVKVFEPSDALLKIVSARLDDGDYISFCLGKGFHPLEIENGVKCIYKHKGLPDPQLLPEIESVDFDNESIAKVISLYSI